MQIILTEQEYNDLKNLKDVDLQVEEKFNKKLKEHLMRVEVRLEEILHRHKTDQMSGYELAIVREIIAQTIETVRNL